MVQRRIRRKYVMHSNKNIDLEELQEKNRISGEKTT